MSINKKLFSYIFLGIVIIGIMLGISASPQGKAFILDMKIGYYAKNDSENPKLTALLKEKLGISNQIQLQHYELIYDVKINQTLYNKLEDKNEIIYIKSPEMSQSSYLLYQYANIPIYEEKRIDGLTLNYIYAKDYMNKLGKKNEPVRLHLFINSFRTVNNLDPSININPKWKNDPLLKYYLFTNEDPIADTEIRKIRATFSENNRQNLNYVVSSYINWITKYYKYNLSYTELLSSNTEDTNNVRNRFETKTPGGFLKDGVGICQDFAYFLSYALSNEGIPTRLMDCYFTDWNARRADAPHACVEVYDGVKWCIVDPTLYTRPQTAEKKKLLDGIIVEVVGGTTYETLDGYLSLGQIGHQTFPNWFVEDDLNAGRSLRIAYPKYEF